MTSHARRIALDQDQRTVRNVPRVIPEKNPTRKMEREKRGNVKVLTDSLTGQTLKYWSGRDC